MSHEIDTSNNRANMCYTGEKPWHGLGTEMQEGMSLDEWRVAAGLDWTADMSPITACHTDDEGESVCDIEIETHQAIVRSDTKSVLSIVSPRYKPVQPSTVVNFFKDMADNLGQGLVPETCGSLRGGRKIWMLCKGEQEIDLGGDKTSQYLLMATSYDRSSPTVVIPSSVRCVCQNTLNLALKKHGKEGVRVTHNCEFDVERIREELNLKDRFTLFGEECKRLADRQITDDECRKFVAECLATASPHRDAEYYLDEQDDNKAFAQLIENINCAPGQDTAAAKGTAFGLLQGVTYWTNHNMNAKSQDNRLDSCWFGRGNRINQFAHDRVLQMV